jgi:hypothetical protein
MQFFNVPRATAWVHAHHREYVKDVMSSSANLQTRTYADLPSFVAHLREWTGEQRQCVAKAVAFAVATAVADVKWLTTGYAWQFILADDTLESGMPHTIYNAIVLPSWWVDTLCQHESGTEFLNLVETLVHERVHVWQKREPARFYRLYRAWGWSRVSDTESLPRSAVEQHRQNPDTPDHWVILQKSVDAAGPQYHWLPCVRFNTNAKTLHDVAYYLVRFNARLRVMEWHKMANVKWYTEFYGNCEHCYHPDEAAAVLLARMWRRCAASGGSACKSAGGGASAAEVAVMEWTRTSS